MASKDRGPETGICSVEHTRDNVKETIEQLFDKKCFDSFVLKSHVGVRGFMNCSKKVPKCIPYSCHYNPRLVIKSGL